MKKVKKTRQIRIRKNGFRKGYYSVYDTTFKDGKMTSETLIDFTKKKKDAEKIKKLYKARKIGTLYGNQKYKK